jgi:hypothetical protein
MPTLFFLVFLRISAQNRRDIRLPRSARSGKPSARASGAQLLDSAL